MCVYVSMCHLCGNVVEGQKKALHILKLVLQAVADTCCRCWEPNLVSLKEQQTFC